MARKSSFRTVFLLTSRFGCDDESDGADGIGVRPKELEKRARSTSVRAHVHTRARTKKSFIIFVMTFLPLTDECVKVSHFGMQMHANDSQTQS